MKEFMGRLKFFNKVLSKMEVMVNRTRAPKIYLWPFVLNSNLKGSKIFCLFFNCKIYVPVNNKIIPIISKKFKLSFRKINANIATKPGVKINNGSAELNSSFLIPCITHKNANAPKIDLKNKIPNCVKVIVERSDRNKKGMARTIFIIASVVAKDITFSLNKTFFSKIAAVPERIADIKAKINHSIIFFK